MKWFLIFAIVLSACQSKKEEKTVINSPIATLSKAIAEHPNNPKVYEDRAIYFENNNNLEGALSDYLEMLKLVKNNENYHYNAAHCYFEIAKKDHSKHNYPELANQHVSTALQLNPKHIPSLVLKGELHLIKREYKEAIQYLNIAIEQNYNTASAHMLKGYIYKELQEEENAIQYFRNAININPKYEDAYIQLGLIYHAKLDSTAVTYYKNALTINPKNQLALYNIGVFYQANEQWNQAIEAYTLLLQTFPTFSDGYYNMGFIHIKLGLYDIAINDFSQAIAFSNKSYQSYFSRGHCYETLGDVLHAEMDYKKAIEINPSYQSAIDALKNLQIKNKLIKN